MMSRKVVLVFMGKVCSRGTSLKDSCKWTRSVTSSLSVDVNRCQALLQMADLMAHHRGMPELLPELAKRLQQVASFKIASFSRYDSEKNNANAVLGGR